MAACARADGDGCVFPLLVFVHGTGGFRINSANSVHHWASRGFVVVSADYPGIMLHDLLSLAVNPFKPVPRTDQEGDTRLLMAEIDSMADPRWAKLGLAGRIARDREHRVVMGHSAGGFAVGRLADLFGTVVTLSGAGVASPPGLPAASAMVLGAVNDSIVPLYRQRDGYASTPAPKRLAAAAGVGHQFCSDLCWISAAQGGIARVGLACGIAAALFLGALADDGCQYKDPEYAPVQQGWSVVEAYSAAVMEETARCDARMTLEIPLLQRRLGSGVVADFAQQLR